VFSARFRVIFCVIGIICVGCLFLFWRWGFFGVWENTTPFPAGLPLREIVFAPDPPYLASSRFRTLGFVHPDGTGRVEYRFALYDGSRSMWGARLVTSQGLFPRWSLQGELLFSMRGIPPVVRLITQEGKMFGFQCDAPLGGRLNFDPQGNIIAFFNVYSSIYQNYQGYQMPGSVLVGRHDLKNCRMNGVILLPALEFMDSIGENSSGWLVTDFYDSDTKTWQVLLYHPERGTREVFPGLHPSFSDDGEWLAYYRPDGYLVIRRVEGGEEQVLVEVEGAKEEFTNWPEMLSMPGWSGDGKWLVVNDSFGRMYIIHRENGQKKYIGPGWAPDWR
jgi:hypothetical protein